MHITDQLAEVLPGFGEKVALDSTAVRSHSNPNRKTVSDPEASWTAKNSAKAKKGGKEWHFGYKYHAVADATYGVPITGFVTTASRHDSPELPKIMEKAQTKYGWFSPDVAIADKGYDARSNHEWLAKHGITPIIHIRSQPKKALHEGIYTDEGVPTCMGLVPMDYVRSDPQKGHLYQCRRDGCILRGRRGVRYCEDEVWEDPKKDIRLFGSVRRGSREWREAYALRQSIERVFKGLKESRRLEKHCVRGLKKMSLHCTMSVLAFQATALVHLQAGEAADMRWMVRRVA